MKFENLFILILALIPLTVYAFVGVGFMGGSSPLHWDLLNEDCSDISDWSDLDNINGVSEVDPAGQFRMDANTHAADNRARRERDIGSYPDTFTVEIKLYHDSVGTGGNDDYFELDCFQSDELLSANFCSDGLLIYDTDSGNQEVGIDLVKYGGSAEWQTWRFLVTFGVTGDGTCDVYLDDSTHSWELVGDDIPCSHEYSGTDGATRLTQFGYTTDDMLSHVDHVKIATGLHTP